MILLPDDDVYRVMRCRIGTEAVILGMIDLELRPLQEMLPDLSAPHREEHHNSRAPLSDPLTERGAGAYARASRERIRVSFREAQAMTLQLAAHLEDDRYAVALGSLSDAETYDGLPRNISKIFSLCVAYCMDLWEYLRAGGVAVDELNGAAIPRQFLCDEDGHSDGAPPVPIAPTSCQDQASDDLIGRLDEVPFFLLRSIGSIISQEHLSLDDMYVWSNCEPVLHPMLHRAMLLFVNRRQRRVPDLRSRPSPVELPLFLIRAPDRRYHAGVCALDRDVMLVCPHSTSRMPVVAYPARDVVVIGRISAVLRSLGHDL